VIERQIAENYFRFSWPEFELQFDCARLRVDRHELVGELSVSTGLLGANTVDGVLCANNFNFSSVRGRQEQAKRLRARARTNGKIDFDALLEEVCQRVILKHRAGQPATLLRTLSRPPQDRVLDVHGFRLFRDHPVIAFGDGGVSKSYLALYFAGELTRRGLSVLFCDWELSAGDHRDRLERLFGADDMPDVRHVRCDRPLTYEVDRLARLCQQHNVEYLVFDSIAFACDGPPEAADVAGRYFQAVRQLGRGSLHLAHINRSDRADEKPFGSTFWHNGARATWYVKRAEESLFDDRLLVGLYNKKSNLGRRMPAVGYLLEFTSDRTIVRPAELAADPEMAAGLPLRVRLRQALKEGPQTLASLAERLNANVDSIDKAVRRQRAEFTRITGPDGVHRVDLLKRESV